MRDSSPAPRFPRWPATLMVCLAASQIMISCRDAKAGPAAATDGRMTLPVVLPRVTEVPYELSYVAALESAAHFAIKAPAAGLVEEVLVDEGERVEKGRHLFTVGAREIEAELAKVRAEQAGNEAEARIAGIELENTRALFGKKIISRAELDLADAKLEAALAKVGEATAEVAQGELRLQYSRVVAPADGVISRIPHKAGSRIGEGETLTAFSGAGDMVAYFHVSEKESAALERNRELFAEGAVALVLADGSVYPLKGRIDSTDSVVSAETGSISYRARFANPDGVLKHGASGRVTLGAKVPDALVIPQRSTFEVQHKLCVYVLDADNVVRMRAVTPSFRLRNHFVIGEGLRPDERIVYEGIQRVREGDLALAELKTADQLPPL